MRPPDVSLVVPVRDEAGNIAPLMAEIRDSLDGAGLSWEAFVVDDGPTIACRGFSTLAGSASRRR